MVREGINYHLVFEDSIEPVVKDGEDKEQAVERITRIWSGVLESYIRTYPEQWVWMHNRWKTQK